MLRQLISTWNNIISDLSETQVTYVRLFYPWGKHRYEHVLMVIANHPEIFYQRMNDLVHGFELPVRT